MKVQIVLTAWGGIPGDPEVFSLTAAAEACYVKLVNKQYDTDYKTFEQAYARQYKNPHEDFDIYLYEDVEVKKSKAVRKRRRSSSGRR